MILSIWKPKYKKINGSHSIMYYYLIDVDEFLEKKNKGLKVVYTCDICLSGEIHNTTSHVLVNEKVNFNTIQTQICRRCRSHFSETLIKKSYIPYDTIKELVNNDGYQLLTSENDYMISRKKSQFHFDVICSGGHNITITWNNWSKGRRCLQCFKEDRFENAVKYMNGWRRYSFLARHYTEISYREYRNIINPNDLKRGIDYHLDHKYSVYEGFKNNISPKIIGGYKNLEIITSKENLSKGRLCSVELKYIL